jgi:Mycobacterial cell wall arabinan synthesis protein
VFNGSLMRRGSVALMLLVALFFVIRRPRTRELLDVPARSLVLGLPLLVVTWSKLPQHFGVFIGLTAVAVGAEAVRFRREAERSRPLSIWAMLFLTALFVAGAWSWAVRSEWSAIDLGTLDWRFGFETKLVPMGVIAALLPLLALFVLMLVNLIRRGRPRLDAALWRVASWAAPLLMVPIIATTLVVFTVDTVRSSPWTIRRQNLETLVGRQGCGLADHVHVASEARGTARLADLLERDATRAFIAPDVYPYFPCARQPRLRGGVAEAPDYVVKSRIYRKRFLSRTSPFHGVLDLYRLERLDLVGGFSPRELGVFAVDKEIPGAIEVAPDSTTVTG